VPLLPALRTLRRRLRALVAPGAARRERDDELRFHLDMEAAHNERLGFTPRSARVKARRDFGDPPASPEGAGAGAARLGGVWRDVRVAARSLLRTPAFSAVAVLTLALGIGASTAVFSVVDGVLLRPLPFPEPDRLVRLYERSAHFDRASWAGANVVDVQRQVRSLAAVAYASAYPTTVLGADEPLRATVAAVSPNFLAVLGARPERGRGFAPEEGAVGGARAAVVSHRFWRTALGGDLRFAHRTLRIGDDAYPIVGVMPASVTLPSRADVWVATTDDNPSRTAHNWAFVVGRLAPGADLAAARTEVDALMQRVKATYGKEVDNGGATVGGLREELGLPVRTPLLVLSGAVAFVVLIGCVNLASASLARGEVRQREFAVRTALGAGRGRIARQLLTETLVIAALGGALGVALAVALTRGATRLAGEVLPGSATIQVDTRVLAFAAASSLLTGLLVGLAPAVAVTRNLRGSIAAGGKAGIDGGRLRARGALIGFEVALAVALLAGAGLLVRSLGALLDEELGFRTERILTADLSLPGALYTDSARIVGYYDRLLAALRELPGVDAAGVVDALPLGGSGANSSFMLDGGTEVAGDADYRVVDSTYFRALGIPLRAGRGFGPDDRPGAPHALVINETAARRYWPGTSPLGHRVRFPGMDRHAADWLTIVGVVGDARSESLDRPADPAMFIHYPQRPERLGWGATVVVHGATPPARLADAVRARVRAVDPNVPVRVSSLDEVVAGSVAERRFMTNVLSTFAAIALALAALGIYGVLAYAVAQRRRAIGVRMALGAPRGAVRGMVIRDAMAAVVPGALFGVAGAVALTRFLRGMLHGVSATDPASFAAAVALLGAVAFLASWLPARRATRVDPLTAIRAE
jgi:predicted permease